MSTKFIYTRIYYRISWGRFASPKKMIYCKADMPYPLKYLAGILGLSGLGYGGKKINDHIQEDEAISNIQFENPSGTPASRSDSQNKTPSQEKVAELPASSDAIIPKPGYLTRFRHWMQRTTEQTQNT